MKFILLASYLSLLLASANGLANERADTLLQEYLSETDSVFSWKKVSQSSNELGKSIEIELTSQVWMDMTWKHVLMVYEPIELVHRENVLLFITGGGHLSKPDANDRRLGMMLAQLCRARVAMLHQVPNQPLLGGLREDGLITETFVFRMASGDKRWPLLYPMVKSTIRAMDCVEQLADKEWNTRIRGFVVSGASKRGWTTWLTGTCDQRVLGISPIVIDTLNFPKQMEYQLETWGRYSEQIDDYERKGLIKLLKEDPNNPIWKSVDPFSYREKLQIPKLILNGTNDRYWTVDALNNYFDELIGPKYIRYVPNAGHNLRGAPGSQEAALMTLAVFFQHTVEGKSLPSLEWNHLTDGERYQLNIQSDVPPKSVTLWLATSPTKDFRDAKWTSKPAEKKQGVYQGEVLKPQEGHLAFYGEVLFNAYGYDYSLSTQIRRE